MAMPSLAHAPDRIRLLTIAERCSAGNIGPVLASPFFRNPANDSKLREFNARAFCFCQALTLKGVEPMFITQGRAEQSRMFAMLRPESSDAWSLFLQTDKRGRARLSSLALATGTDNASGISYPRRIVERAHAYFAAHGSFLLAGAKEKTDIVLPGLESYLARLGMGSKEIWVESYLIFPHSP